MSPRYLATCSLLACLAAPLELWAADWPQHQCDAKKSGFQPTERIKTSQHFPDGLSPAVWSWKGEATGTSGGTTAGASLSGQPVVAEGIVAIGSIGGKVVALNAQTGVVVFTADVGAPVLNSLAIADGKVIAATQGGLLIALDKATGSVVWTYRGARKGYAAPPTIADGKVFIGSKDGRFHAVKVSDGTALWQFDVGGSFDQGVSRAPILGGASVLGSTVFFGAENMHAYALRTDGSAVVWRRQVFGQSFANGWAVASSQAGGTVIFRTQPIYTFHLGTLNPDETFIETITGKTWQDDPRGSVGEWVVEQRAISKRLADNPSRRSLWELDVATGRDRFAQPLPVLYTFGIGDTPAAPAVADSLGRAWVTARSVYAIFDGMGVRSYGELIKLNLAFDAAVYTSASPQVSALGMQFFANPKAAWEDFHKIADEGEVLTACQNAVLSSTWVSDGGIDIETEQTFNVRGYSSDDLGGAALYGTGAGIVIANGHVFTRDSEGIKAYKAAP